MTVSVTERTAFALVWPAGACVLVGGRCSALAGRSPKAQIRVSHPTVSREQAVFERRGDLLWIRSAHVTVPTSVDGETLWGERVLVDGAQVGLAEGPVVQVRELRGVLWSNAGSGPATAEERQSLAVELGVAPDSLAVLFEDD